MTAAYRFKGIGWFGGCVAIVLGFYLVSLQVAAERKKLEGMDRKIDAAQRDIRALETEFETRANLAQLEKWNGETLALAAPVAGQFVTDETALASLDVTQVGIPPAGVQTAALVVPSLATTSVSAPTAAPIATPATVQVAAALPTAKRAVIKVAAIAPRSPRSARRQWRCSTRSSCPIPRLATSSAAPAPKPANVDRHRRPPGAAAA